MPYAHDGQISQSPIDGGIEITQEQYQEALAGMLIGKVVTIEGGFAVVDPPEVSEPVPEPEPIPEPAHKTVFSSLDYLQKFTAAEYAAARTGPVSVQFGLDMLIAAQFVDLDDPRVAMTLDMLMTEGIITEARRNELLTPEAL